MITLHILHDCYGKVLKFFHRLGHVGFQVHHQKLWDNMEWVDSLREKAMKHTVWHPELTQPKCPAKTYCSKQLMGMCCSMWHTAFGSLSCTNKFHGTNVLIFTLNGWRSLIFTDSIMETISMLQVQKGCL